MVQNRIQQFLQRLTPMTRSCLLAELERLETCDSELPGSEEILGVLRAEFVKDGSPQNRLGHPARYFFEPLEQMLVEGAPEHANSGRVQRGSLLPIWEWITRDLLRTMTRDYVSAIERLVTADNQREARKVAAAFQTKVIKSLEGALSSPEGVEQTRVKLATYTASRTACGDLAKILCAFRARDALRKFNEALPATIKNFDDEAVSKITTLLDAFVKEHNEASPFALTLVANRLKTPWELIRLATKASPSKNATDIAATRYAIAVSLVLDRLDDKRLALRLALRNNRVFIAKQILRDIYATESALRVRLDMLDQSEWGRRLREVMDAIAALVEAEIARFPDEIDHVLGSRSLRSDQSLAGRLTSLAWKGRDAISDGAAYCRKLIGQTGKSGGKSGLRASAD
jgi:hypothetical protein